MARPKCQTVVTMLGFETRSRPNVSHDQCSALHSISDLGLQQGGDPIKTTRQTSLPKTATPAPKGSSE